MPTEDKLAKLLEKNIEASNRTTHAVRALVLFLFIQLSFLTAAAVLWQLGLAFPDENNCSILGCEPNGVVTFLVVALVIAGVFISSMAGWDEIRKSNVEYVADDVMDADEAEKNRIQAEALKKAEEERERQALIEQARIQKEEEARLRARRELLEQRKRKLIVTLKKPWVLGISLLVTMSLIASGVIFFVSNPSWSTLVKSCDSLMSKEKYREDSYTLSNSQDELWLITLDSPTSSKWVDCIGWNLAEGSSTKSLRETLSSISIDGENFAYGNLDIFTIKQGMYYKIRISKID